MRSSHVLRFPATLAGFERAFGDLRDALDTHDLDRRDRYNCELVFDEIVTNIIKHAYQDEREHGIEVTLDLFDGTVIISFEDDGVAFDPRDQPPPEPTGSILDASVGGRGLWLVRNAARRLDYERTPGQRNRLTVTIGQSR